MRAETQVLMPALVIGFTPPVIVIAPFIPSNFFLFKETTAQTLFVRFDFFSGTFIVARVTNRQYIKLRGSACTQLLQPGAGETFAPIHSREFFTCGVRLLFSTYVKCLASAYPREKKERKKKKRKPNFSIILGRGKASHG